MYVKLGHSSERPVHSVQNGSDVEMAIRKIQKYYYILVVKSRMHYANKYNRPINIRLCMLN